MTFRAATEADAETLFRWRQEQEAKPWYVGRPVSEAEHRRWLLPRLRCELVKLRLWLEGGEPAGVVRIDSDGSLSFAADSRDVAARMLRRAKHHAGGHGGRLKCCVDRDDAAACEALLAAGFRECSADVRMFIYRP